MLLIRGIFNKMALSISKPHIFIRSHFHVVCFEVAIYHICPAEAPAGGWSVMGISDLPVLKNKGRTGLLNVANGEACLRQAGGMLGKSRLDLLSLVCCSHHGRNQTT